jgi:hypothetical protein
MIMAATRGDREQELQTVWTSDCIRLVRIYQDAIGMPHGQVPIPGPSPSRMIDVILKKEFPPATPPRSGAGAAGPR